MLSCCSTISLKKNGSVCLFQALLEGISLSQPQTKIPSELIKFLGKTYNAWHIAIPLLESHVMLFPTVRTHPPHSPTRLSSTTQIFWAEGSL